MVRRRLLDPAGAREAQGDVQDWTLLRIGPTTVLFSIFSTRSSKDLKGLEQVVNFLESGVRWTAQNRPWSRLDKKIIFLVHDSVKTVEVDGNSA